MNELLRKLAEQEPVAARALHEVVDQPGSFTRIDVDLAADWPLKNYHPAGIVGVYLKHDPKKVRDPADAFNRMHSPLLYEFAERSNRELFAVSYANHLRDPQAKAKGRGTWHHNQESQALGDTARQLQESKSGARLLGGYILWRAQGKRGEFASSLFVRSYFVDNLQAAFSEKFVNGSLPREEACKAARFIIADMLPIGATFRDRELRALGITTTARPNSQPITKHRLDSVKKQLTRSRTKN